MTLFWEKNKIFLKKMKSVQKQHKNMIIVMG